ncbi:MAG: energy-coupling factor transporter transmembrane protein EcfT [Clostridiales bacterium]|jgi:energy-coupling factor transport system permease protein|nr:energy-coupling factor transporter transmembrane protein EcfT [Clostridiales bacterium]
MLRDITLGQYYPVDSPVHRLDPRVKILLTMAFIVCVFLVGSPLGYVPIVAYLALASHLARLPYKMMLKALRPLRILLVFTFVLNLFFGTGQTELIRVGFIRITQEGLLNAVHFSLRLIFLVTGSSILTLTTAPVTLTDGLERLASPLKIIRFPAHEMAMMMTIALRFIPTLAEEADKIMKAQSARGADFTTGSLRQRARALIPLLVPLFVSAFRRAGDLAMAMESRCYRGGEGRTRLNVLRIRRGDWLAMGSMVLLFAVVLLMKRYV